MVDDQRDAIAFLGDPSSYGPGVREVERHKTHISLVFVGADTVEHIVLPGDVLLLCSDGLHGAISAADMAEIVNRNSDLNVAARQLIDAANERHGGDNVSVQLIRVRSVERIGMYRGRPYKLA